MLLGESISNVEPQGFEPWSYADAINIINHCGTNVKLFYTFDFRFIQ